MAYAYVYAPISGTVTGRDSYCSCPCGNCNGCGSAHGRCKNWASPIDIAGTGSIYLYVNYPTVRRVQTWVEYKCCCQETNNSYARSITVDLYVYDNGKYCYVGSVMYGHIANPTVNNGQWIDLTSSSLKLGDVIGGTYTCTFTCYSGAHVHLERNLGETVAPCCCASVTAGTTAIYRFYYNAGSAC
jgi:hypothetical protein